MIVKSHHIMFCILGLNLLNGFLSIVQARTIYVDSDANGLDNGTTWNDA